MKYLLKMMAVILLTMMFSFKSEASNDRPLVKDPFRRLISFNVLVVASIPCPGGSCLAMTCYHVNYTIGGGLTYSVNPGGCTGGNVPVMEVSRNISIPSEEEIVIKQATCEYLTANPLPEYETQPCP